MRGLLARTSQTTPLPRTHRLRRSRVRPKAGRRAIREHRARARCCAAASRTSSCVDADGGQSDDGSTMPMAPTAAPVASKTGAAMLDSPSSASSCSVAIPVRATSTRWPSSTAGSTIVSPVMRRSSARPSRTTIGPEREQRLAEGAGVGRHDEADLRHLPAPVGPGLVVHDDDVLEEQHADAHRCRRAARQLLRPLEGAAAEVEAVEVDAAQPQDSGAEHVPRRARLLFDHAVGGEGGEDPVHGRRRKPQAGGQVRQAQPAGPLEGQEDPDGSVDTLDHDGTFRETTA